MSAEAAIARARDGLAEEAKWHKRVARFHRDKSRELMQKLAALEADLAQMGVRLEIDTQPDQGGHSGSINGGEAETV
jgi:hypothetical protein